MTYSERWQDADDRMFTHCFEILGEFVTEELGQAKGSAPSHRGFRLHSGDHKAIDLWLWYRDELPALVADVEADTERCYGPQPVGVPKYADNHLDIVKDEKLAELMQIRTSLWT